MRTEGVGHAIEIAMAAAERSVDRVIAIGGDGTVHEVINGLMNSGMKELPSVGIVPVGSGNDFAFSLGISNNPSEALKQSLEKEDFPVDIGYIKNSSGRTEYWSNAVGIGFDAIVVIYTREMSYLKGFTVYFVAVLKTLILNHEPFHIEATIDGQPLGKDLLLLALCNGKREGGGFFLAPEAKLDDNLLNYVTLGFVSKIKLLASLPKFLDGSHTKLKHVSSGQFEDIKIRSDKPLVIHTDGEIYSGFNSDVKELQIGIIPAAIRAIKLD